MNRYSLIATYKDANGKKWQAVPEIVNSAFFYDGYELVSPPLTSVDEGQRMQKAIGDIERSGEYVKGRSSATHFTFDISSLIGFNDDCSKIVNLILFLEQNITYIYQALGPQRYGHVINEFSIPLAINQEQLLQELAELPVSERKCSKLRAIFMKHHEREILLTDGSDTDFGRAWKYRAINYGKFLGLGAFASNPLPVIEIRIADLVSAVNFLSQAEFLTHMILFGSEQVTMKFQSPFPRFFHFRINQAVHKEADQLIKSMPHSQYEAFITKVGLSVVKYPPQYNCIEVMKTKSVH